MRFFILMFLTINSLYASGPDHDYKMRVTWVKTLKQLFLEIEKKEPYQLVKAEREYLERFKLISEAWAESDSPYNCVYGGWPSIKKGRYCQNPSKTNPNYDKGACGADELQCQPNLFGKGLCAPGATQAQRNRTFSTCEKKFQKEKNGNYDFLKNLSRDEVQSFHELSITAANACGEDKTKLTGVCKKILSKLKDGLRSIDQSFQQTQTPVDVPEITPTLAVTTPAQLQNSEHTADCPETEHTHGLNLKMVDAIQKTATAGVDEIYDEIKANFLNSPFCDPHSVIADPKEKPGPIVTNMLLTDLLFIDFITEGGIPYSENLEKAKEKFNLSSNVVAEVMPMLEGISKLPKSDARVKVMAARAKSLLIQDYLKNYQHDPDFGKEEVKAELAKRNIFKKNANGEVECPFMTKDAFLKALAGREEVLKSHGKSLKNKKQLTIVDYTRPSNERRMFVIDLESKKVLHNTWVAHGSGGGNAWGVDGLGSSPQMSNKVGSNMSSDGFVIASHTSYGPMYGNNVILKGIDSNNSNMQKRAVILHKWSSPYADYSAGTQDYVEATDSYGPVYDITEKMKNTNFRTASKEELERSLRALSTSVYAPNVLSPTWGCLGVPLNNIQHLDSKGRNTSQLEALREDLPGTLMFNYSGPDMSSKFF